MNLFDISIVLFYLLGTVGYFAHLIFQKDVLHRVGFYMLLCGFLIHSVSIVIGFAESGQITVRNLHETLSLSGWIIAGVFLTLQKRLNLKILGVWAAPLLLVVMIIVLQLPREPVQAVKILDSVLIVFHVVAVLAGDAALALAGGVGVLYLLQEWDIKNKKQGFFFKRLPSLDMLDRTGYACIIFGFISLTLGLIGGLVYSKTAYGRFWGWDSAKEIWSGVTWLIYAALIHERLVVGWRGRRSAIMAIIGFIVLLFTFFGVNFLFKGQHGNFTGL